MFEDIEQEIQDKLAEIAISQAAYEAVHGKYEHIPLTTEPDFDYSVTEYVCPDNSAGYQVLFYKSDSGKDYIRGVGYGEEATDRTFAWREQPEPPE